jgi:ribosome-binding protein aMBF1 (putative translation factor)
MKNHVEAERGFPAFLTLSWAWQESIEDPAAVKAAVARNLRHYRELRGLSRKALAQASAISLAAIRELEAGGSLPDIVTLARLADALGLSCAALVECGVSMATGSPRPIPAKVLAREARAALA